jgi:hypothetical protein
MPGRAEPRGCAKRGHPAPGADGEFQFCRVIARLETHLYLNTDWPTADCPTASLGHSRLASISGSVARVCRRIPKTGGPVRLTGGSRRRNLTPRTAFPASSVTCGWRPDGCGCQRNRTVQSIVQGHPEDDFCSRKRDLHDPALTADREVSCGPQEYRDVGR